MAKSGRYAKFREAVIKAHPYCAECMVEENLTIHHIVPLSKGGGRFSRKNVIVLCRECHDAVERGEMYVKKATRWIFRRGYKGHAER